MRIYTRDASPTPRVAFRVDVVEVGEEAGCERTWRLKMVYPRERLTVGLLKKCFERASGFPASAQVVYHKGLELILDPELLRNVGVRNGDFVVVLIEAERYRLQQRKHTRPKKKTRSAPIAQYALKVAKEIRLRRKKRKREQSITPTNPTGSTAAGKAISKRPNVKAPSATTFSFGGGTSSVSRGFSFVGGKPVSARSSTDAPGASGAISAAQKLNHLNELLQSAKEVLSSKRNAFIRARDRAKTMAQSGALVTPEAQAAKVVSLKAMGFSEVACQKALILNRNDVEYASNWILERASEPSLESPLSEAQLSQLAQNQAIAKEHKAFENAQKTVLDLQEQESLLMLKNRLKVQQEPRNIVSQAQARSGSQKLPASRPANGSAKPPSAQKDFVQKLNELEAQTSSLRKQLRSAVASTTSRRGNASRSNAPNVSDASRPSNAAARSVSNPFMHSVSDASMPGVSNASMPSASNAYVPSASNASMPSASQLDASFRLFQRQMHGNGNSAADAATIFSFPSIRAATSNSQSSSFPSSQNESRLRNAAPTYGISSATESRVPGAAPTYGFSSVNESGGSSASLNASPSNPSRGFSFRASVSTSTGTSSSVAPTGNTSTSRIPSASNSAGDTRDSAGNSSGEPAAGNRSNADDELLARAAAGLQLSEPSEISAAIRSVRFALRSSNSRFPRSDAISNPKYRSPNPPLPKQSDSKSNTDAYTAFTYKPTDMLEESYRGESRNSYSPKSPPLSPGNPPLSLGNPEDGLTDGSSLHDDYAYDNDPYEFVPVRVENSGKSSTNLPVRVVKPQHLIQYGQNEPNDDVDSETEIDDDRVVKEEVISDAEGDNSMLDETPTKEDRGGTDRWNSAAYVDSGTYSPAQPKTPRLERPAADSFKTPAKTRRKKTRTNVPTAPGSARSVTSDTSEPSPLLNLSIMRRYRHPELYSSPGSPVARDIIVFGLSCKKSSSSRLSPFARTCGVGLAQVSTSPSVQATRTETSGSH